jgi:hypothetical protein
MCQGPATHQGGRAILLSDATRDTRRGLRLVFGSGRQLRAGARTVPRSNGCPADPDVSWQMVPGNVLVEAAGSPPIPERRS